MLKKKKWLAFGGVVMATLLIVSIFAAAFPKKKACKHVFDEGTVAIAATCTTDGKTIYTCTECGETETEVIPAGHMDEDFNADCDICSSYMFEDSSKYTEVDAVNGDLVANTWYRFYVDRELETPFQAEMIVDSWKIIVGFFNGSVLLTLNNPESSTFSSFSYYRLSSDYVDFYLPLGFNCEMSTANPNDGDAKHTLLIDENTDIYITRTGSCRFVKLIFNS